MRLQQLKCVIEVDKRHSISAAARNLYMGPTTLGASIKSLEEELGAEIFRRSSSGVELTDEGTQVVSIAKRIDEKYEQILRLGGEEQSDAPLIRVIMSPGAGSFMTPLLEEDFALRNPRSSLEFCERLATTVAQRIIRSEANVGISHLRKSSKVEMEIQAANYQIEMKTLGVDHLYLVVRKDHPLAGRKRMSVSEIQDLEIAALPQCRVNKDSLVYEPRMGYSNRYTTLPSIHLLKRAVAEQGMAAIMCGYGACYEQSVAIDELHPIYLYDSELENEMTCCVLYRKDFTASHYGQELLESIERCYRQLPIPYFAPEQNRMED